MGNFVEKSVRSVLSRWLRMSPDAVDPRRLGFPTAESGIRAHLTHVAQTFLTGYNLGLQHEDTEQLGAALVAAVSKADQGFAFEGAAMATSILDTLVPGPGTRFQRLFEYAGSTHAYMLHVGAGGAVARLPFRVQDPGLRPGARAQPMVLPWRCPRCHRRRDREAGRESSRRSMEWRGPGGGLCRGRGSAAAPYAEDAGQETGSGASAGGGIRRRCAPAGRKFSEAYG
jgi:hypothetical protein